MITFVSEAPWSSKAIIPSVEYPAIEIASSVGVTVHRIRRIYNTYIR